MDDRNVKGPLAGVRVLDLTRFPPGAYCTLLLGDLGAEVCRVDAPGSDPAMAGVGVGLSRGKRSVGLDLRHQRGNEVLSRLAGWADVLVENNRPGDLEKRGFGYVHAAAKHP
jgi:alpha-methylacyl-CoA racemase